MSRTLRILGITIAILVAVAAAGGAAIWLGFRASLPTIEGTASLKGLGADVFVERDAAGVPTITASNRNDLARGLGYVHAQDRYFQMDLLRRAAAGELSALLGPALLDADRRLRVHQFRKVARAAVAGLVPAERAVLEAYVAGVNAGLESLRSRPFEYWLLRTSPRPWTAEDTVLCVHAMYLQLQDAEGHAQLQRGLLRATLPEAVWTFLEAQAPEWDATVDDTRAPEPRLPLPEEYNVRAAKDLPVPPPAEALRQLDVLGSNNWAVAGARTADGSALIANDMHLGYRVPTIWYRARLVQTDPARRTSSAGPRRRPPAMDVTGVTLPGTPAAVAGSNGSVAWGFTNSYGAFATVVRLVGAPGDPAAYETASGVHAIRYEDEPIEVAGGATERFRVALTEWGPIVGHDWEGRPYALQWTAQDPLAANLEMLRLERAGSVQEALELAPTFGIPGQNFMVADRAGHIGWTIAGHLPGRGPGAANVPQMSTEPQVGFDGWLNADDQPQNHGSRLRPVVVRECPGRRRQRGVADRR